MEETNGIIDHKRTVESLDVLARTNGLLEWQARPENGHKILIVIDKCQ